MIHVELAPEPEDFDEKVRQKGLNAIKELVGEPTTHTRRGRPRASVASSRSEIPPNKFPPYWREALEDMLSAYKRICAYMCVYIERVSGSPSVDHVIPKSKAWDQVYEWNNYRLACSMMNSRKGVTEDILDPTKVENGWFTIELVGFQVCAASHLSTEQKNKINHTIEVLGLNGEECRRLREEYATHYWERSIAWTYLEKRAPFVAMELKRQNRLLPENE